MGGVSLRGKAKNFAWFSSFVLANKEIDTSVICMRANRQPCRRALETRLISYFPGIGMLYEYAGRRLG